MSIIPSPKDCSRHIEFRNFKKEMLNYCEDMFNLRSNYYSDIGSKCYPILILVSMSDNDQKCTYCKQDIPNYLFHILEQWNGTHLFSVRFHLWCYNKWKTPSKIRRVNQHK